MMMATVREQSAPSSAGRVTSTQELIETNDVVTLRQICAQKCGGDERNRTRVRGFAVRNAHTRGARLSVLRRSGRSVPLRSLPMLWLSERLS
jgi:hypothetical protein